MGPDELCACSLADVSRLIERREVSPIAITEAVLARVDRLEPRLNAFITVTRDEALGAARAAEAEIARGGYRGTLHGVPISLKDLLATQGVRTTAGARVFADRVPTDDATTVGKLRAAGAVIVGKTNMLEVAYGEVHPDFGPSRNPWHLDHGTSGSSSGSGAAVAAGLGYGSLGSDTGGSIRLPAAYCGIVGLKPTYGLVSRHGALPLAWSLDHIGPMTRTVRDCAILLGAIAGHDPSDPASARVAVPDYAAALDEDRPDVTIGIVAPATDDAVAAEVRRATDAAAEALRGLGFATRPVDLPDPEQTARALLAMLYAEASSVHVPWLRKRPADYGPNTRERLELGALLPASLYLRASRVRRAITEDYARLFERVDLLLTPAAPSASYRLDEPPAAPVGSAGDRMAPLVRFSGPFNLTGQPALTVPCGLTAQGLPIGVQLVARPFAERTLFQVAHRLEREMVSRVPRPRDNPLVA